MSLARPETDPNVTPLRLLMLAVPALLVGVVSALILWTLDSTADALSNVIWTTLPGALNVDPNGWWIILVLTVTGLAVGIALQVLPGHGGPDSATTELVDKPLPLRTLPGLAVVTLLGLAGGVSLGPENPIIAINTAIIVAVFARLIPQVSPEVSMMLAASATIGALFGTPVAAALVFTGLVAAVRAGGSLWDKLFLPLAAAGAASITMHLLGAPASRSTCRPTARRRRSTSSPASWSPAPSPWQVSRRWPSSPLSTGRCTPSGIRSSSPRSAG